MAAAIAGALIAFYQMGYGIARVGVGVLEDGTGLSLNRLYGFAGVIASAMAVVSFVVVPRSAGKKS